MRKTRCHYGCWYGQKCLGISRNEMIEILEDDFDILELDNKSDEEIQKIADNIKNINEEIDLEHIKDDYKTAFNN